MDIISYALSTNYTEESLVEVGALKGAPCTIKSIVHRDGINTITFEWTASDGTTRESVMIVYDGTPIYVWESGNTYHYGDLVIYESAFYRCIRENSDLTFDNTKWNEIGSPDGNYDIVENSSLLPARFTAADKKLYFSIGDNFFWLWDGTKWEEKLKVDSELNSTSQNAVQNKTVKAALDQKADVSDVPTNTSDLTNDSDFVSDANYVHTDYNYDSTAKELVDGVTSALSGKVDKNGTDSLMTADEHTKLGGIATGAQVNTIEKITVNGTEQAITNKTVALTLMTNAVNDLVNYYKKSDTYTQSEVDALIASIVTLDIQAVDALPTENISSTTIYLLPKSTSYTNNAKDEYINTTGTSAGWEKIGDTEIDLSNYVTSTELNTILADYVTRANLTTILADYATTSAMNTALSGKLDTTIKGASNGVAELGADGKVPSAQLPDLLTLGETSTTAYRGDRGKTAYDDSQANKTAIGTLANLNTTEKSNLVGALNEVEGRVGYIEDVVPSTATSLNKLATESDIPNISVKADKVENATSNDLAKLDANGNIADSGIAASNIVTKSATAGLLKNDGTVDTTNYATESGVAEDMQELTEELENIKDDTEYIKNNYLPLINNAGSHNSIYRGKYLGAEVTAEQYTAIGAGTFKDLYIGDYWTISGVNYRIAHFDYWLHCGEPECTTHHVVIVPDTSLYTAKMNNSNVTTGAYVGSAMYTTNLAQAKTTITNAFGASHILNHREYLTNAMKATSDPTYESAGSWYDSTVELMNERMVYGADVFHNVEVNGSIPNNYTIDKSQLALFALDPSRICNRANWWLRCTASASRFAGINGGGHAYYDPASTALGVRPAFGIKA